MTIKQIIGIVLVVIGLAIGASFLSGNTTGSVGTTIGGGDTRTNPMWLYGGTAIGVSGQLISNVLFGTCDLTGPTTLAVGTSSIAKMDCAVTGVKSGDIVNVQLPNTSTSSWYIIGASASSTNGYLQVLLNNQSATTTIPSTVKTGLQYIIFR